MHFTFVCGTKLNSIQLEAGEPTLLLFSGHIYRRSQLIKTLRQSNKLLDRGSDEALFLASIELWGNKAHLYVEGSFLAVYSVNDSLFIIRGVYDSPAIYYVSSSSELYLSMDVSSILNYLPKPVALCTKSIRHYLAFSVNLGDSNAFVDLQTVAAGQGIKIGPSGEIANLEVNTPMSNVAALPPDQLTQKWREAMISSLTEMAQQQGSIALFLTGGIDSGAIAAFGAKLGLPLHAINMSLPDYIDEDEWGYANQLAGELGIPCDRVLVQSQCFDDVVSMHVGTLFPSLNPYQAMLQEGYQYVSDLGINTVWTGSFGDEIYPPNRNLLLDLWNAKQWQQVARLMLSKSILNQPQIIKTWINNLVGRQPRRMRFPDFMLDRNDDNRYWVMPAAIGQDGREAYQRVNIFQYSHTNAREIESEFLSPLQLDRAHPYMHPDIIEVGLGTPSFASNSDAAAKLVMRKALSGLAPNDVIRRARVGILHRYYFDGWTKNLEDIKSILLDQNESWSRFVKRDCVVDPLLDNKGNKPMLLLQCLALELWLNKLRKMELPYVFC